MIYVLYRTLSKFYKDLYNTQYDIYRYFVKFIKRCYVTTFKIDYQYFCKYLYNIINYALYELLPEIFFLKMYVEHL